MGGLGKLQTGSKAPGCKWLCNSVLEGRATPVSPYCKSLSPQPGFQHVGTSRNTDRLDRRLNGEITGSNPLSRLQLQKLTGCLNTHFSPSRALPAFWFLVQSPDRSGHRWPWNSFQR